MATPTTRELTADSEPSLLTLDNDFPATLSAPSFKHPHTPGIWLVCLTPTSSHLQHKEDLQERVIPELGAPCCSWVPPPASSSQSEILQ